MKRLLIALLAGFSLASQVQLSEAAPLMDPAHAAHLRLMLQGDGIEGQIDASLPRLRAGMMQAVAQSRGEASLAAEETRQFDRVSQPVLDRLRQQFIDDWVQNYAALSDTDIDDLIQANDTPLGRRFIAFMVQSMGTNEPTFRTYATETADAIGAAYDHNAAYVPKTSIIQTLNETPAGRLLLSTGNAAMCDEVVENYFSVIVAGHLTQIDFDKLSKSDSDRLYPIFAEGLSDLGQRMKALMVSELAAAFSADELDQLTEIYALPAVQSKIHLAVAMLPEYRKRNQAAIRAAYDEVIAGFGAAPDGG